LARTVTSGKLGFHCIEPHVDWDILRAICFRDLASAMVRPSLS